MNRRGFHGVHLVTELALLVVTILLAVVVFIALKEMYEQSEQDANCASQIRIHASAVKLTKGLKEPPIVCPTEKIPVAADEDAREKIANAMVACWDTWGRGEYRLFGSEDGTFCHICAVVEKEQEVTGLATYLAETSVPKQRLLDEKVTYEEYLSGVKYVEGEDTLEDVRIDTGVQQPLPASVPVGVVFYYVKGLTNYEKFFNQVVTPENAMPVGATTGGVLAYGVISAAGGGIPLLIVGTFGSAVGGGYLATWLSLMSRYVPDYVTAIVVRPLTASDIQLLGCTYAPVAREP